MKKFKRLCALIKDLKKKTAFLGLFRLRRILGIMHR
jgi:hypothetical protein